MLPCPICGRELVRGLIRTPHIFPIPVKVIFVWESFFFLCGKIVGYGFPYFFQPFAAVVGRAVCDDAEHFSFKGGYAAESKDAVFPDALEGIAEDGLFALLRGIGGIENQGRFCFQKADGKTAPVVFLGKDVGYFLPQNAVHPPFHDGGRLPPPVDVPSGFPRLPRPWPH